MASERTNAKGVQPATGNKGSHICLLSIAKQRREQDWICSIASGTKRSGKRNRNHLSQWLLIDNNLVENAIRPIALGRKNYLFAGSHDAVSRAGMLFSFLAICKKHEVNPLQWLKHTLESVISINHKNIRDLYPQNYKN